MVATISTREWTEAERLTQEKLALGFYLSGHPFAAYAAELAPIVRTFPEAEVLITGVENPDTRAHAPDESLHLADFERACLGEALLLHRLAGPDGPGQHSSSR